MTTKFKFESKAMVDITRFINLLCEKYEIEKFNMINNGMGECWYDLTFKFTTNATMVQVEEILSKVPDGEYQIDTLEVK